MIRGIPPFIVGGGETGGDCRVLPGCAFKDVKWDLSTSKAPGRVVCFLGMAILGQSEECLGCVLVLLNYHLVGVPCFGTLFFSNHLIISKFS